MWATFAVAEEDKLDRETTRRVLRRTWRLAQPYKRTIRALVVLVTLWTATTLAGPVIVKIGIDEGLVKRHSGSLNGAVVAYVATTIVAYVLARLQFVAINRAGEGFLRDLRVRVFDHLQLQSLAFFDREKTGVLVARMTADIESMAELVQWGLLSADRHVFGAAVRAQLGADLACTRRLPDHCGGLGEVSARLQQGLPDGARTSRPNP
jgi:ATP-binding cassette, subfamily B, bacterial